MTTKQQQRERAERRRKLEEFWRWACGDAPATYLEQLNSLPLLCRDAVWLVENELVQRQFDEDSEREMKRDLSLAQLEVLEMLEERVGERVPDCVQYDKSQGGCVPYDVVSIGGRSSGKTEYLQEWAEKSMEVCRRARDESAERMRELYQRFEGSNEITLHQTRVTYERLQHPLSKPYNPRKDLFPPPPPVLMSRHPWEFK